MNVKQQIERESEVPSIEDLPSEEQLKAILSSDWKPHPERTGSEGGFVGILVALVILAMIWGMAKFILLAFGSVLG